MAGRAVPADVTAPPAYTAFRSDTSPGTGGLRVALVCMPWASPGRVSLGLSLLRRSLRRRGISSDVHYLNLLLASRMDLSVYERITRYYLVGDWLFSRLLFGEEGSGELANRREWIERQEGPMAKAFFEQLDLDLPRLEGEILPSFLDACLRDVPWDRYAVVGFTSVFVQQVASLLLARRVKERFPSLFTVFGGVKVSGVMGRELVRAFDWVDFVVDGEGEEALPQLVAAICEGDPRRPVAGVSSRSGDGVAATPPAAPISDWNRIPVPDFSDYFHQLCLLGLDRELRPPIPFEGSRGCRWGERHTCAFCGLDPHLARFRPKPARRVLRELRAQARRHRVLNFEAVDNMVSPAALLDLFPKLASSELDYRLFFDLRATFTREQVALLHRAGVRQVEIGIESLHSGLLGLMGKGVTALHNLRMLKWCRDCEIAPNWYLLYGCPGESRSHYQQMLETLRQVTHLPPPSSVFRVGLERHSPYFRDPARWGIDGIRPKWLYRYIYPEPAVRLEELAYHFEFSWPGARLDDPEEYIQPVRQLVREWQEWHRRKVVGFRLRRGPGFIELLDSRPLDGPGETPLRRTLLTGVRQAVFACCDTGLSLGEIVRRARLKGGQIQGEGQVVTALRELVAERLLYEENGRYLSLAVSAG